MLRRHVFCLLLACAPAGVALPAADECLDVVGKGADATGVRDSAAAFQAALDAAQGRQKVCVPQGTYRIGKRLLMRPGTHLVMHRDAVIANAAQVGAGNNALLMSESFVAKTNHVTIEGGTFTSSLGGRFGGRVVGWYGDDWTVRNVFIRDWGQDGKPARAINAVGNNARIIGNTIRNPGCGIGCAAIVFSGGDTALIEGNDVSAGDDGIAIFPVANPRDPTFNLPIRNVRVINNRAESSHARALALGMHHLKQISETPTDTTVEGIYVQGLTGAVTHGKPTAMAVLIENMTPRGAVRNVVLSDVHIERTNPLRHGFKIAGGHGPLSQISIQASSFTGTCIHAALYIDGASDVRVERSRFVASPGCAHGVLVKNATFRKEQP